MIAHLVAGPLFAQSDTRAILVPPLMKQLFLTSRSTHAEEADNAINTVREEETPLSNERSLQLVLTSLAQVLEILAHLSESSTSPHNSPRGPSPMSSPSRSGNTPEDVAALYTV